MTPEEQAEYDLRSSGFISGAAKMGTALPMGVAKIAGTSLIKGIIDDEQTQESALASFNQKFERTQDDINNTNTAEFVDALGEISPDLPEPSRRTPPLRRPAECHGDRLQCRFRKPQPL